MVPLGCAGGCPNKKGRGYSRPESGTGMPTRERFQRAPGGARVERCLLVEIPRFRYRQQPKLRELILLNWFSGRFFLTARDYPERIRRDKRGDFRPITPALSSFEEEREEICWTINPGLCPGLSSVGLSALRLVCGDFYFHADFRRMSLRCLIVARPPVARRERPLSVGRKHFDMEAAPPAAKISMKVRSMSTLLGWQFSLAQRLAK